LVSAAPVPLVEVPAGLLAGLPFQSTAGWWRCVLAAGLPADRIPRLLLACDGAKPVGFLPLCDGPGGPAGLVTPYTCLFQPTAAPQADYVALGLAFARAVAAPVLRLDALDPLWPGWGPLLAGFAAAGWRPAWFESFGNWHTDTPAGWPAYLAARPGALRETIRRKLGRAEASPEYRFVLARQPDEAAAALADYEVVYRSSWKPPEPFPRFNAAFVAEAAAADVLRLGVLHHAGTPIAAQYWTVETLPKKGCVATVLKLAHDENRRQLSPGTVLTAWMIRALLAEGVTALDFGRGDDPYKQLWATARRQRRGLILARPLHPRGAAALARQALGQVRRRLFGAGTNTPDLP
jgi:CelD/BcsL family acetyltransferase involved in cellulose biosynthesis